MICVYVKVWEDFYGTWEDLWHEQTQPGSSVRSDVCVLDTGASFCF